MPYSLLESRRGRSAWATTVTASADLFEKSIMSRVDLNSIAAIEAATRPFRNALDHRNFIVEGIRQVASRNMIHLTDVMQRCDRRGDAWVERVQAVMLEDQGMEDNRFNRAVLPLATLYPVQIYLALLYAQIEFFEKTSKKLGAYYRDPDYRTCIDEHEDAIALLKPFRDSFLHPRPDTHSDERRFLLATPDSYNLAPYLQREFDGYLHRVRARLFDALLRILYALPDTQRLYCFREFFRVNARRMAVHQDETGLEHLTDQANRLSQELDRLPETAKSWSPNGKQRNRARRLAQCLDDVSPSMKEQQYATPGSRQTPMSADMILMSAAGCQSPLPLESGDRRQRHLVQNAVHYQRLVDCALILWNENIAAKRELFDAAGAAIQGMSLEDLVHATVSTLTSRQLMDQTALSTVATALASEPLGIYWRIVEANPATRNKHLDRYLRVPGRLQAIRNHRNVVFHIEKRAPHPVWADLITTDPDPATAPADPYVLSELCSFLFRAAKVGEVRNLAQPVSQTD